MTQWILIARYFRNEPIMGSLKVPRPDVYYVGLTNEPLKMFERLKSYSPCRIEFYCCFAGDEAKREYILEKYQAEALEPGFVNRSKEFESFLKGLACAGAYKRLENIPA